MAEDSSDYSELDSRPSGSRGRYPTRSDPKRKRRIVMRIEFDDSEESSSSSIFSEQSSSDGEDLDIRKDQRNACKKDLDDAPSCSRRLRNRQNQMSSHSAAGNSRSGNNKVNSAVAVHHEDDDEGDSDEFQRNAAQRRLRSRRTNLLDVGISDGTTSGSEINIKSSRGKAKTKYIMSEDEAEPKSPSHRTSGHSPAADDNGFSTDSSSNELLEKCPICLLTFRRQEIGSPSSCQHIFCVNCIEAWSKNVQTCPIDRLEFERIIVRESYENRRIVREINVDPNAAKELILDDDPDDVDDVTNCEECGRPDREDVMLLCDQCNQGYHMDCLSSPLSEIPEGSWYCDNCVDSEDEAYEDEDEDLNMLYEDIRGMGLPETRLRVREVQQPRILRTRQNERIRAAVLRRTRATVSALETTTTTTTTSTSRGRPRTTTTTTTTRRTTNRSSGSVRKPRRPKKVRRRAKQRTYVVEYDVNNFDEKFAIKTTKKVIKRRRKKARSKKLTSRTSTSKSGARLTASQRLAEQLGVKPDPTFTSHLSGSSAGLSLTGGANDLEYFSDSDNGGNIESEIHIETGQGTAVQTSVRISNYGSQRSRKGLLLGRVGPRHIPEPVANRDNANSDILSSIMDLQDRWHSASRNLESIHINSDGTLNLPSSNGRSGGNQTNSPASTSTQPTKPPTKSSEDNVEQQKQQQSPSSQSLSNGPNQNEITQAPMYSRGGGNSNFNTAGGGGYNRYGNNQNNYRGGGAGNQYRPSAGGGDGGRGNNAGGINFNMVGRGNFNFSSPSNFNNQNQPGTTFSPFRQWNYNQRNQQNEENNQNNNRRSLAFGNNNQTNDNTQSSPSPQQPQNPFSGMPQPCYPPPAIQRPNQSSSDDLFGGLPPPVRQIPAPVVLSVPPPPTPPAMMVHPPAGALFQLNSDYGRDDDSNCPNFAIYSQESQEVAKSSEAYPERKPAANSANEAKEDDENEDLVQLDDDEEMPMPPQIDPSDLYEPENPTEENDDDEEEGNTNEEKINKVDDNDEDDGGGKDANDNEKDDDESDNENKEKNMEQDEDEGNESATIKLQNATTNREDHEVDKGNGTESETELENNDKVIVKGSKGKVQKDAKATDDEAENDVSDKSQTAATKDDGDDFDDDDDSDDNEDVTGKRSKKGRRSDNKNDRSHDNDAASMNSDETSKGHTPTIPYNRNTVRSPSPAPSDAGIAESEARPTKAGKGHGNVIELYDDSDWDELNADKNAVSKGKDKTHGKSVENGDDAEPDRSYTPCLDENNDPEVDMGRETPAVSSLTPDKNLNNNSAEKSKEGGGGETDIELIISEEEPPENNRKKRGGNLLDPTEEAKSAKFKKVKKRKKRNYRGDKQPFTNRFRRRSFSRSRSRSRRRSRSRLRSHSRSRSRSYGSFRSRSRSPGRGRRRGRSHSRSDRREKRRWGGSGNLRGRSWDGGRIPRNNKPKRRELPRYDVRHVVANKPVRDRFGRDNSRARRASRSMSRRRSNFSRSPFSRSGSRSRLRSRSRRRSFSRSRSRSPRLRSRSKSRSISKSRSKTPLSRSRSRSRPRRPSISLSPSPQYNRRRSLSPPPRRFSPIRRRSISPRVRRSPMRRRSRTPLRVMRSRSISLGVEQRMNGHKPPHRFRSGSRPRNFSRERLRSRSRSISLSPRYTPQMNRLRSKSPPLKSKKKKKDARKKKSKRRLPSLSPSPNRRIARQADPFGIEKPTKKKRRHLPKAKSPIDDHGWSPSPSPAPPVIASNVDYQQDKNISWTPPMHSPILDHYPPIIRRSVSPSSRKEKGKRSKKKKKESSKRRTIRKEKKRRRRTETPEPIPSKEVFASGNNILVSVSFNKENTANPNHGQQTIVTLPPNREDLLPNRRVSIDHVNKSSSSSKKRKEKRKKVESKPVAIIDLERSPFQVEQEQTDVIVLTDSEENRERAQSEHRRDRRRSESCPRNDEMDMHRSQRQEADSSQRDKSPERMDTILEESYDIPQTGPKTPPEPPGVKFNLQSKKTNKVRNPLHEDDDYDLPTTSEQQQVQETHNSDLDTMHVQSSQKIGPNTPPESGPCSPDAYDPFEPTKSPSISPRSPTPPPSQLDVSQNTEGTGEIGSSQKHHENDPPRRDQMSGIVGSIAQGAALNPIDLVMALMGSKNMTANNQDLANKSNEPKQYSSNMNSHDEPFRNKSDDKSVTVLSNVLLSSGNGISSPTPPTMAKKILPLPKITGSVGGSSSSGVNMRNGGASNNNDDAYTLHDADSPYSPGSGDYEDLFEPPPDTNAGTKRYSKRGAGGKVETFDNLFGSSSPVLRLPSYTPSKKHPAGASRPSKTKGRSENPNDAPNTLDLKERFLRKLNRQERVVEEVKLVLKPRYNKKHITKEDYKEIMRRAVPKICHSRSGEIDPNKIKNLIDAYVKKFRSKHKKLSLIGTGQVSSAVKCAAYLKKL
ncbi:serine/arginine repetitive matrix protein 2 [Stomoxys calcitrans]|uniref:serine/arginine repetitive matrix protein 2 n=1 Tax=Stomoxys calcitrans TaxID=35570 RepID=UPI0027E307C5|nr:serine/arginine repetitive matrix protein 2 [Stomoxys calcitrans]